MAPVVRQVETWNVKLQELKETAQVPSSEGLIARSTLSDSYLLCALSMDQDAQ